MAGLGFKDFQVGEVLTSSDVDGYLMQQTVMRFADSAARGSALGTAAGTGVALAEGMVSYLDDSNRIEFYNGSGWVQATGLAASTAITVTDATWSVPSLGAPVVKVTVVGAGGGGGGLQTGAASGGFPTGGATGGSTLFGDGESYEVSAAGGGGGSGVSTNDSAANRTNSSDRFRSNNGGGPGNFRGFTANAANGGEVVVAYVNLAGVSTVPVTIGAGGAGGTGNSGSTSTGGSGGDGVVIVEYVPA